MNSEECFIDTLACSGDGYVCEECERVAMEINETESLILRLLSNEQRKHKGFDYSLWVKEENFMFLERKKDILPRISRRSLHSDSTFYRAITKLLDRELIQRKSLLNNNYNKFAITIKGDVSYVVNRHQIHGIDLDAPVEPMDLIAKIKF